MHFNLKNLSILCLILFSACSTQQAATSNDREADDISKASKNTESIVIMGTNDIHGTILPIPLKSKDNPPVSYESGGVAYISAIVKKLRTDLGDRFLWLDAGDEFQGSIESNTNAGSAMVQFFNTAGLNATAVGNHEFDFGPEPSNNVDRLSALKNRMSEAHYPYLAANIFDAASGELEKFPNSEPSKIFRVGKIKVGVIGLSTVDTPTTTRPENVTTLKFGSLKDATLKQAAALRSDGADLVVITAHAGLFCDLSHTPPGHLMRKPSDPQGECKDKEEIVELLKSLPAGTVDAVVSGHTHTLVYHYVAGVPVIQGGANGRYVNLIHLTYDFDHHRVLPERTRIEGPIPICPKVFANQGDCNGDRPAPSIGRGPLITPVFRREEMLADTRVQEAVAPAIAEADKVRNEVYGKADRRMDPERYKESPLGNLVADALKSAGKADFAITNSGGIRAPIDEGPITYGAIFRTVPFDNEVMVLTVDGKQLKQILRVGESGSRGFHSVSGLDLKLISPDADAPADDLNGNGKIDPWEINRILEVTTVDGKPIDDHKQYTLATLDYLTSGGDDYGWVMSKLPEDGKKHTGLMVRDAVASYIRKLTTDQVALNSIQYPMIDPEHPRMTFVKPKPAPKKHGRRRRRPKVAS